MTKLEDRLNDEEILWRISPLTTLQATYHLNGHEAPKEKRESHEKLFDYVLAAFILLGMMAIMGISINVFEWIIDQLPEQVNLVGSCLLALGIPVGMCALFWWTDGKPKRPLTYAITDKRLIWSRDAHYNQEHQITDDTIFVYINLEDIEKAILKRGKPRQDDNGPNEIIEWYGTVQGEHQSGVAINKMVFESVLDALRVVKLVEQARGTSLPIIDLRGISGKKKA